MFPQVPLLYSLAIIRLSVLPVILLTLGTASSGQTPGCTDPLATNFNPTATQNDGTCLYPTVSVGTIFSQTLDTTLMEISGLIQHGNGLMGIVDQNDNTLYELDTLTGSITNQFPCGSLTNYNWEELTQDSLYFYLGDIGNNINGNRTDLRIYKVEKNSLITGNPIADTIAFSYATQTDFTPTGLNNTDYDCEAFIVTSDSIYLFTKQWLSFGTVVYSMPNQPGLHSAIPIDSFPVQGLIAGATAVEGKQAVVLCGYSNLVQPFLYLLYDFTGHQFFSGNKRKVVLNLPFHQIESVCTTDGIRYYLANEGLTNRFITVDQKLHLIDLGNLLSNFLFPISTGFLPTSQYGNNPILYPNPTTGILNMESPAQLIGRHYRVTDTSGRTMLTGIFMQEIDASGLKSGDYIVKLDGIQPLRFNKL